MKIRALETRIQSSTRLLLLQTRLALVYELVQTQMDIGNACGVNRVEFLLEAAVLVQHFLTAPTAPQVALLVAQKFCHLAVQLQHLPPRPVVLAVQVALQVTQARGPQVCRQVALLVFQRHIWALPNML